MVGIRKPSLTGGENLSGDDNTVLIATHGSPLDAAILAAASPRKLHLVLDSSHQLDGPAKHPLAHHRVTVLSPSGEEAKKLIDTDDVDPGEDIVFFPQSKMGHTGSIESIDELAMKVGLRHCAGRFAPVHVEERGADHQVHVGKARQCVEPSHLDEKELSEWRRMTLLMMLEEAHFGMADLTLTLPMMLLRSLEKHGKSAKVFSQTLPTPVDIEFGKLAQGCFALGKEMANKHKPGERVGLMMPTVAGTAVVFYACHFAGLVPVMLNFSAGPANTLSAVETAKVQAVYTSKALLDKLEPAKKAADALTAASVPLILLEEMRKNLSVGAKINAVLGTLFPHAWFQFMPGAKLKPESEALILFSSGSEGLPKGVVLTHRNLIANAEQIMCRIDAGPDDLLFNSLPVFHSFGMMAGLVLPVFAGLPTLQFPSPLLYKDIPQTIADKKATIFFSTSTFLDNYASRAKDDDFTTLRLIISGGEKLREGVADIWERRFGKKVHEGYGVTETAPALAINNDYATKRGTVGLPLPGIDCRIEPVDGISEGGRLQVSGPNVMKGYLFAGKPDDLVVPSGGWHDTGDIAVIDSSGFIKIVGRHKRFAKIAGEMVPLVRLEEVLDSLLQSEQHGAVVSLPDESRGEVLIFVTDGKNVNREKLHAKVVEAGLPELWAPKRVQEVDEFPLLPTGKADYPAIERLVQGD